MNLLPDWKQLIKKAWSLRLIALSGLCIGVDAALPFLAPAHPSRAFSAMAGAFACFAFLARLVPQKGLTDGDDK